MLKKLAGILILMFSISEIAISIESVQSKVDAKKPRIIEEIISDLPLKNTITYTKVPRGIILSVAQSELFEGNSDYISYKGKNLLKIIAEILDAFGNKCTIEAHTEEVIYNNEVYDLVIMEKSNLVF